MHQYKTNSDNKNATNECRYLLKSNLNRNNNVKRFKAKTHYLQKGFIKNYNINKGKKFYDQPIDRDIKHYEELKKVIGQGEGLTKGYLFDYKCIRNHFRLIAVDLTRQKNRC